MIAAGKDIEKYIPQRAPVVMIDALWSCDDLQATTSLTIQPDNIFVEQGRFTEAGLLENIAQTAAAKVGYECARKGIPVPPGFIGAIKNLGVNYFPKSGETVRTMIRIENEIFGMTLISGEVSFEGQTIAKAEMKIVLQTEAAA